MRLYDYFDPYNIDHVRAIHHLNTKGELPQSFCDEIDNAGVKQEINLLGL